MSANGTIDVIKENKETPAVFTSPSPLPLPPVPPPPSGVNEKAIVISLAVVLGVASLCILAGVLYMVAFSKKKRTKEEQSQPPAVSKAELNMRKARLELAFGDLEPKVKRELVTMKTNQYGNFGGSGSMYKDGARSFVALPVKCHM